MKITCNVIQDLLPSYVDGILSRDSRELVEEHLKTCEGCRKMLEIMKADQEDEKTRTGQAGGPKAGETENKNTGSAAALKKIRKKLRVRRIITAAAAVVLTLAVAAAGYQHWYFNEKYMTLEESGMYVKNNALYSTKNLINRIKVKYTEDGATEFVYAIDAPYAGTLELKSEEMLLQDFSQKTEEQSPEDESIPATVKEVYYMSEDAWKKSCDLTELEVNGDIEKAEKLAQEMKAESEKLWAE